MGRLKVGVLGTVLAVVLVASIGGTQRVAAVDSYACVGAPADYVTAFDSVRGQAVDGAVTYSYKTAFIEFQGQLTKNDGITLPGPQSEHIHEGACLPLNVTLTDANASTRYVDARYIFFNVSNYEVFNSAASLVDDSGSANVFQSTAAQTADMNAAMQASADAHKTATYQSYTLAAPRTNGVKEFRWTFRVVRSGVDALVDDWRVSGRSYFDQEYAGLPSRPALGSAGGCKIDFVRTQNWTQEGTSNRYNYAGLGDSLLNTDCSLQQNFTPDVLAQPRPASWDTNFRETDGTEKGAAYVDPNTHVDPPVWAWAHDFGDIPGSLNNTNIPVTVPVSDFAPGLHVFVVQGHEYPQSLSSVNPVSTAVVVMPFLIPAPPPPPGDTEPPTKPGNFHTVNPHPTDVKLAWQTSTDNVGVVGYHVYTDGAQVADVPQGDGTGLGVRVPSPAGTHLYEVGAYDAAGNESQRASLTYTTCCCC